MKNARVFLVENYEGIMKMAIATIEGEENEERKKHTVVLTANSFAEAKAMIEIAAQKANVAVIDSYHGKAEAGREIAEALKAANPEMKIMAYGWYRQPEWGKILDAWVDKSTDPAGLGKAINKL